MRLIDADVSFYEIYRQYAQRYRDLSEGGYKTVFGVPMNVAEKIVTLYLENCPTVNAVSKGDDSE